MAVRLKVQCVNKEESKQAGSTDGPSVNLVFLAVADGSPENREFFKWTPSGSLHFSCCNPAAAAQFTQGALYYIDITPVAAAP